MALGVHVLITFICKLSHLHKDRGQLEFFDVNSTNS